MGEGVGLGEALGVGLSVGVVVDVGMGSSIAMGEGTAVSAGAVVGVAASREVHPMIARATISQIIRIPFLLSLTRPDGFHNMYRPMPIEVKVQQ